ncbi:uncharacterized protein VTP21DRAFT_10569 [Calcarisporiella thermophila]|uniref:uncharacterized protein n=1 Tax=Calcarisporiella thermophila TaxID=911321 RepID=UPI0037436E62
MNIDSLFKLPAIPSGRNKRKLPSTPDKELLDRMMKEQKSATELEDPNIDDREVKRRAFSTENDNEEDDRFYESGYNDEEEEGRFHGSGLTEEQERILSLLDAADEEEPEGLDLPSIKKMILKFEKAITKNQELRAKYPDDPTRFMESEADLDVEIKRLMVLTQVPEFYPEVVRLGTIATLTSLLSHENTDISIDAVEVLHELTDEDVIEEENEEAMKVLVRALVENNGLELLAQNISRLDENETTDYQGVFNTLGIFENLTSIDPSISELVVTQTELLRWLLQRVQKRQFDSNRQYASEILAILLQNSRKNRLKFGELGGVDALLMAINQYKRKDPKDADETEMMENLFDALCSALGEPEIKDKFLDGEGIELMLILMREKNMSKMRAIKVLNYATSTKEGARNCERFVEAFGLKALFSAFMQKGYKNYKKIYKSFSETEEEEHIMCIIISLLKNLTPGGEARTRLINKFIENNYEKVERLVAIRAGYNARVAVVDREIEREKERLANEGEELDEEQNEEFFLRRLDAGLFTLQMTDLVIAYLCWEDNGIKGQIENLLLEKEQSLDDVREILIEYYENLGDEDEAKVNITETENKAENNDPKTEAAEMDEKSEKAAIDEAPVTREKTRNEKEQVRQLILRL